MASAQLPPLKELVSNETQLDQFLSLMLEPSPVLHLRLTPAFHAALQEPGKASALDTYSKVLDYCETFVEAWLLEYRVAFLAGHPLIGEVKGLSAMSANEQGGPVRTPQVVLDRLAHLNALYTKVYPGLPYITFVNGRPRSAIVTEIEEKLNLSTSPIPLPGDYPVNEPALLSEEVKSMFKIYGDEEWMKECDRAVKDVFRIAKSRLVGMRLE